MSKSDNKTDIGSFRYPTLFYRPVTETSATGEEIVKYVCAGKMLASVTDEKEDATEVNLSETATKTLSVTTWKHPKATTDWKICYNGLQYSIIRITSLENGMFAVYECSLDKIEEK